MSSAPVLEVLAGDAHLEVPRSAWSLDGFRAWVLSERFPATGARATFVAGAVRIDMSPESIESHNKVKTALTMDVGRLVRELDLGELYSDRLLFTNAAAGVSTEPDLCFASWDTLSSGRVRLVPRAHRIDEYAELSGAPDLVVEIVSDSSEDKDLRLLRAAYARAGVREYWIVDARHDRLRFEILRLRGGSYRASAAAGRAQRSVVLGATFRLTRSRNRAGRFTYALERG